MVCFQGAAPLVSVVTSAYNAEKFAQSAINSILTQTFRDFEFLILNDGSTDRTDSILREVAASDPRVTAITQERMRIPRSLNKGTALARGKYIARQDADDISVPTRLAKQVDFLERHPDVGAVGSFAIIIDERNRRIGEFIFPVDYEEISATVLTDGCFVHGSLMLRRTALLDVGGYRQEFLVCSDFDMYLRLSERFKVANLSEVLYYYRRSPDSTTAYGHALLTPYHDIARELARQRREQGRDMLMPGSSSG